MIKTIFEKDEKRKVNIHYKGRCIRIRWMFREDPD
jgi:hypothetical protein